MLATNSGACLLAAETGTGKTPIVVEFCKRFNAKTILIIAPLQTMGAPLKDDAEDSEGWWDTFDRQQLGLNFRQIDSSVSGMKALADLQWGAEGVYFVGKELFARWGWEKTQQFNKDGTPKTKWNAKKQTWDLVYKKLRTKTWDVKVDVVVFDEVHNAQNGESATSTALIGGGVRGGVGAPKAKFKIGASGTYEGNSFDGAWAVTRWLWPDLIDASKYVWRDRWAAIEYDHFAVRNQKVVGEREPGAFVSHLPCYVFIEADFGIEVIEKEFWVDLYPEQRRVYDELEKFMVAWVKENPLVVKFPITKRIRQRQATLGMPELEYIVNDEGETDVIVSFDNECISSKIDKLPEILEKFFEGEPALIYTDSEIFAEVLTFRLNKMYGVGVARKWSGKVKRKVRNQDKADFIAGKYRYMVATIASIGTGTNLLQKAARNILLVSRTDNRIGNVQGIARLVRGGQDSPFVRLAHLLAHDTEDDKQYRSHIDEEIASNKRKRRRK